MTVDRGVLSNHIAKANYALLWLLVGYFSANQALAKDSNIPQAVDELETKLLHGDFEIVRLDDVRFDGDITKRAMLRSRNNSHIRVKLRRAEKGAQAFNNQPRYEIAAYRLQKLLFEPAEYVVPPTVGRALPLAKYRSF